MYSFSGSSFCEQHSKQEMKRKQRSFSHCSFCEIQTKSLQNIDIYMPLYESSYRQMYPGDVWLRWVYATTVGCWVHEWAEG